MLLTLPASSIHWFILIAVMTEFTNLPHIFVCYTGLKMQTVYLLLLNVMLILLAAMY